ncbi:MAG: hypothetical protein ACFNKL_04205 [Treponema sp.]
MTDLRTGEATNSDERLTDKVDCSSVFVGMGGQEYGKPAKSVLLL